MNMKSAQERLLKALANALVVFGWLAAMPCSAATTLTLAHIYTPEHPSAKASQRFAEMLKENSRGRIQVKLYAEGALGNQTAIIQSLKNGSLDLSMLSQGSVSQIAPEFNVLGLPYLFPSHAAVWRLLNGSIGQQLVQKLAAKGVVVLDFWDVEVRHFSNSVHPIIKPADLAGLKIRNPPDVMAADIVSALGCRPMEIMFSDLYKALQAGVVDGQDNTLINFQTSRLYDVQKFISLTGHRYSVYSFLMNKSSWDKLSAADRDIVMEAAHEASRYQRELSRNAETEAYRDLVARGVRINKVDVRPFVAATAPVYDKWYASPIGDFVRVVVQAARERQ
ncbi:MAG: TRAP transporter substrate-binding protein [Betaproteobacteria bacterium]